jgi:hypothetical protein
VAHVIAQTLHGYEEGHRLLVRGGEVSDAELGLLDRLSDLSGYVPIGTQFDAYHTGFPCGRYYAFACTWPDTGAARAGTVFTHTLLIPLDLLDRVHDLWALDRWHRRPASPSERAPYAEPVMLDLDVSSTRPPTPTADRALAAIVLWFGQPERPVLWMEDARPADVARYLWSLLWTQARQHFAFCTFALQVRHVRRKLFGFLALPPTARGSFHDRASSSAWWKGDGLASAALVKRTGQPWALGILERGASATWAMPRFCEEHSLPVPDEQQLATFLRFRELEEAAGERLTAARARTDLLERLWPDLPATHPLSRRALEELLRRQADAPMSPRPFWDLGDLLARRNVESLAETDDAFARDLGEVIAREVPLRLREAGIEAAASLTALLGRRPAPRLREAILRAVQVAFERAGDGASVEAKAALLLAGGAEAGEAALAAVVLGALPPARRVRVALDARHQTPPERLALLGDHLGTAALELRDAVLAAELCLAEGRPLDALPTASRILALAGDAGIEQLQPILARLDAESRLTWALDVDEPSQAAWAGERGAEAARELTMVLSDLFGRCAMAPNGARVLFARLAALPTIDLRSVLRTPGIAVCALPPALEEEHPRARSFIDILVEALPDGGLLSAAVAEILAGAPPSSSTDRLADRLAPRLVQIFVNERHPADEIASWLGSARIRGALERLPPAVLFGAPGVREWSYDCLPNLAHACAARIRVEPEIPLGWVAQLLERPLGAAYAPSVGHALVDLDALLSVPPDRDGWILLAARVLAAVRRTQCKTAYGLVERAFPAVYPKITRNALSAAARAAMSSRRDDWDVAKEWRHWLLDQWIEMHWPSASFLRCLGNDEDLFRRIAHRAARKWGGKDLLRSLPAALTQDDGLRERWRAPVARVLREEDLGVDYE